MSVNVKFVKCVIVGGKIEIYLTPREVDCVLQLLKGKTAKEVAKKLMISPRTVEDHLKNIRGKIGCWSRSQLITFILESNFFQVITRLETNVLNETFPYYKQADTL